VSGYAAAALIVLGLLAWVVGLHYKALRYFDRPGMARNPYFDPAVELLKWALLIGGLFLLARESPTAAVGTTAVLLLAWSYRRFIRSVLFQRWLLRRDFLAVRARRPDLADREILFSLVIRRHPRWGDELIEQMVVDYPTVEALARVVAKMERGFRGFR
jgi:hypothetical protein